MTHAQIPVVDAARALVAAEAAYAAAAQADYAARREIAGDGLIFPAIPPAPILERLIAAQDARREARHAFEAALMSGEPALTLIEAVAVRPEDILDAVLDAPLG